MSKTIIAPIVGLIVVIIQLIFKVDIPDNVVAQTVGGIIDAASAISIVYGIVKNHFKHDPS